VGCFSFWQEFIAIYAKFPILSKVKRRPGEAPLRACVSLQTKYMTSCAFISFDTREFRKREHIIARESSFSISSRQKAFVVLALFDLCDSAFYCM
jgi:hypothetical protein